MLPEHHVNYETHTGLVFGNLEHVKERSKDQGRKNKDRRELECIANLSENSITSSGSLHCDFDRRCSCGWFPVPEALLRPLCLGPPYREGQGGTRWLLFTRKHKERERVLGSVPPTQPRNWHWNLSGPTSYLAWLFWKVFVFTPCQLVGSRLLISHSWASFQSPSLHVHSVRASFTEELQAGKYFGVCLSQMQSPICSFCLGL